MSVASAESRHLPALDGVRGIAILLVLLSHAADFLGPIPYHVPGALWPQVTKVLLVPGWGGVDLFFTLSGFLITGILLRSRASPLYFRSFYARRIVRIFPIYYLALCGTLAVAVFSPATSALVPHSFVQRLSYFLYLQNWPVFWTSWAGLTGLWSTYWSLAVEEQFYLVWPTLVRFLHLRTMLFACLIGFLLGPFERMLLIHHLHHLGRPFGIMQWPFSRLDGLFLGAAIALYREQTGRVLPARWADAALLLGAALYLWIAVTHLPDLIGSGDVLWEAGVSAFALMSAGLIAAVEHRPPVLMRLLSARPLLIAGRYSYGMYIYHLFLYIPLRAWWLRSLAPRFGYHMLPSFAYIALAIALTTAIAALSFHFIEAPFLRLKRHFPSPAAPV